MLDRLRRLGDAFADQFLDRMTATALAVLDWLSPLQETRVDRTIREEGERLRKAFPWLDERRPRGMGRPPA
jgi:hypothetical protein